MAGGPLDFGLVLAVSPVEEHLAACLCLSWGIPSVEKTCFGYEDEEGRE